MATSKNAADQMVLPVRDGEDPWTAEEVAEVREELVNEIERMRKAIEVAEAELAGLMREGSDGAGRDPADVGSSNFERDQEMSLAQNAREMLEQSELALSLFDKGQYGLCESCNQPIGKARLQAFPRATMCVACKQREERR
ncbi:MULTISPECIES: TraR/DksA family transcriptional regulator [unclassified Luteococcus]|uniref:TraR/DksA family transcriptional regulator n=1 Tax=unclassified Luteococcus TaxID=2639923 RepID=UPI00313E1B8A